MFISHFKSLSGKARHQGLLTHDREDSFTTWLDPSGCRKTTLLRMIAGLEVPDEGEIYPQPSSLSAPEAYRFVDDLTISYLPLHEYSS